MIDKYTKITYQTEPIGKEKIILYLTTFDLEAFEKDKQLEKIPTKREATVIEFEKHKLNEINFIDELTYQMEKYIREKYGKQLLEMKSYIEMNRKIPQAQWYRLGDKE